MSLITQLRSKDSSVRQFFAKYEDKTGAKECLSLLQSTKTPIQPLLQSPSRTYFAFVGITADYLIRYIANNNHLDFSSTVAFGGIPMSREGRFDDILFCEYVISKQIAQIYLDGRGVDELAVYSATALAMLDSLRRSGLLPRSFWNEIPKEKIAQIRKLHCGSSIEERTVMWLFDEYCFESLHWELYVQDVLAISRQFVDALKPEGELHKARIDVYSRALANSVLVGGADFDCMIQYNGREILTDIKTTIKPLLIEYLRQLVGYALLHDERLDGFEISDVGIYFSRSGEFRHLPVDAMIQKCFPFFKSIAEAKEAFKREVRSW